LHPDLGQLHPQRHRRSFRRRRGRRDRRSAPLCRILRQWSSLHPEFTYPAAQVQDRGHRRERDRAAIRTHDIGLQIVRNAAGEIGFQVIVGGGQGRTPMIGRKSRDFLPSEHLLAYVEAILRVYNLNGRRDNKYKARIKILVHEKGVDWMRRARSRRISPPAPTRR
jgi:sulfite reductase (NADPH) hemoprotein beta-component